MSERLKTLLVRTASGAGLAAVVIAAVLAGRWTFAALATVIAAGCLWEFYKLTASYKPFRWLGIFYAVAEMAAALSGWVTGTMLLMLVAPFALLVAALFSGRGMAAAAVTLLGMIYVAVPLVLWPHLSLYLGANPWAPLCFLFLIWASDVFAYLVGMSVGRHPMFPRVSPKKTWEGFAGGLVGAVCVAVLSAWWLEGDFVQWAGLGLAASLAGVAGDLVESMFKRQAGVKDSGNILPGHGGWLDRFDALLLAVPFSFAYLILYSILTR